MISKEQAAVERHVYEKLEARDEVTVDSFAEHCDLWMGKEHTKPLLMALIELDDMRWPFLHAAIAQHCPSLCLALDGIINHIEKHRAEFIECEAESIIKQGDPS